MGIRQIIITLVAAILCGSSRAQPAEQIEVVAQTAKVKVAGEVISTVKQGERFEVLRREGPWAAIEVATNGGNRCGWILGSQVRTVTEGLGDDSSAPPGPEIVSVAVNWAQLRPGHPGAILLETTLANRGPREAAYDGGTFSLLVDGKPMKSLRGRLTVSDVYTLAGHFWTQRGDPFLAADSLAAIPYLAAGQLPPGDRTSGWLAFETPRFDQVEEIATSDWRLSGEIAGRAVTIDLKENQRAALKLKVRPAALDESVPVIEVGCGLNGLNVGALLETLESPAKERRPTVALCTSPDFFVDQAASQAFTTFVSRTHFTPTWAMLPRRLQHQNPFYQAGADSEDEVVIYILAQGPGGAKKLVSHLAHPRAAVRAAAAGELRRHVARASVVDALLPAVSDPDQSVRLAAMMSLGPADDPRAAAVLIAAMDDPRTNALPSMSNTRLVAISAAAAQKSPMVVAPLVKLLDEEDANLVVAACRALAQLKAEAAIERLRPLESHPRRDVALAAIEALEQIGAMPAVDAALARLKLGDVRMDRLASIVRLGDERAVPALLAALEAGHEDHVVGTVARALGELGDRRAVEPLLGVMRYRRLVSEDVVRALGKLGDRRAVEPLRAVLQRTDLQSRQVLTIDAALLCLGEPDLTEQFVDDLRRTTDYHQTAQILEVLGRSGGKEAVALIAPYLDDAQLHTPATSALVDVGARKALAPLVERLLDADYPHAGDLVSVLVNRLSYSPDRIGREGEEEIAGLLREIGTSENPKVRECLNNYRAAIDQAVIRRRLADFRLYLENRRFDAAQQAFRTGLEWQLDGLKDDSQGTIVLAEWFAQAWRIMHDLRGREHADALAREAVLAIEKRMGVDESTDYAIVLRRLRLQWQIARLQADLPIDEPGIRELLGSFTERETNPAKRLDTRDLDTVVALAGRLERSGRLDLAAEVYRALAAAVAAAPDPSRQSLAEKCERAIRRLELPGKPIEVEGTTISGKTLDWSGYRGKVVLVAFWGVTSEPARAEAAHVRRLYERYRHQEFEVVVVAISPDRRMVEEFLDEMEIPWATLYDQQAQGWHPLALRYGVMSIPTGILVDGQGNVVSIRAQGDKLKQELKSLLGEGPPANAQEN